MAFWNRGQPKRLKPAGHSAFIEALIQPAIVIGSTMMSAIAAYVLALDEITRVLNNKGSNSDIFVICLCAGMGFLIDMAIIVSATRYQMHAVRGDPREKRWLHLAQWVLGIGLTSEAMTLFYFFVHLDPRSFPPQLVWLATLIHAVLSVNRAFLSPVVIAYFAAGVLPIAYDRADRNREIKSRTSSNIMLLIDKLSAVFDTDDKAEMLRALGGQLMLDTYATYDETTRTSEEQQLHRDAKLLSHLARIHRLDWSAIAADVAPELATPQQRLALTTETSPRLPAMPSSNGQNGKLNNREKRAMLAASMYSGHPTSPRDNDYAIDGGDEDADWATSGSFGADDFGAFGDDGPKFHMNQRSSRGERAQAAHIAPRGAELAVREFVMPDLPASKYEREDDTEQRRAVFRVLDDALANDKSLSRLEVAKLAGVSENTVRSARAIWETLRAADKKRKKAAPKTREMPAVTSDMLADSLTTR